ncbi:MAG: PorP/SprF family type IX secretion system membrane protein [Bacteroidota bacterium]
MFLRIATTLVIMIVSTVMALSQQLPFSNQYLVNRHVLSPAFAGITDNFEAFVAYQRNTMHFPGGPEYKSIFLSGPLYGNMSLGGSFTKSTITIFDGFAGEFDYAYHLRVSEKHFIHFGLSLTFNENHIFIDYNQYQSMQNDPYVLSSRKSLSYGFGLVYTYKTFQLGVAMPRLGESSLMGDSPADTYTIGGLIRAHTSVNIGISPSFSIEPSLIVEKANVEPLWYNVSALIRIKEITYLEAHYRQGNIMGFGVGINAAKKLLVAYSYDLSGTGIMKYSSGIHEISIGFMIGKGGDKPYQRSAFRSLPRQPYYEWVE